MILGPGAERLLLEGRSHRSAYRGRTYVAAGCDARVTVGLGLGLGLTAVGLGLGLD